MFFLLRMAFWLGVVCVLLPSGGSRTSAPDAQIDATQAVTLASAAVSDMRGFCERQPDACAVGGKVASALGHKAEAGARTIYQFITDQARRFHRLDAGRGRRLTARRPARRRQGLRARDRGTLTACRSAAGLACAGSAAAAPGSRAPHGPSA